METAQLTQMGPIIFYLPVISLLLIGAISETVIFILYSGLVGFAKSMNCRVGPRGAKVSFSFSYLAAKVTHLDMGVSARQPDISSYLQCQFMFVHMEDLRILV